MKLNVTTIACILAITSVTTMAQNRSTGAYRKIGTISQQDVNVRAQANTATYASTQLNTSDTVTVLARQGDWLEIEPPTGVFSLISDKFVTVGADGTTGTVTADRVRVRAGTDQRTFPDLGAHYIVQTHLNTGDTVKVTGNGMDYYEIVPPSGVTYYVAARYVTLSDDARESLPTTAGPLGSEADTDENKTVTETRREIADDDDVTRFRQAEEALAEEILKPNIQRDLGPLLAMYRDIDAPAGSTLALAKEKRIRFLENALAIQADQKAIEQMDLQQHERRVEQESGATGSETVRRFDAQGVLRASDLFVGGAVPKRYLLRHPETWQIIAYVEADRQLNLGDYEGKTIGVFGDSAYNSDLGMSVITVSHLVLIDDEAPAIKPADVESDVAVAEIIEEPISVETVIETPVLDETYVDEPEPIDLDELFLDGEMPDGAPLPPESDLPEDAPETIREWSAEPEVDMVKLVPTVPDDDNTDNMEFPTVDERDSRILTPAVDEAPEDSGPARPDRVEFGVLDEADALEAETPDAPEQPEEAGTPPEAPATEMREPLPQNPDLPVIEDDDWSEYD